MADARDVGPVVGMVHLPALPGAPQFGGDRGAVRERALADARALADGGADAVIVENFGDAPFHPADVPKHVVASMTSLVGAVSDAVSVPVGVNVLRNDAQAALGIAAATGAAFVRSNVHVGTRATDQGVIEGRAHETLRLRDRLDADVAVFADANVKHSAPLAGTDRIADVVARGLADAVVVSGPATGEPPAIERVREAGSACDRLSVPLFVGSGVTAGTVGEMLSAADGVVVGTALERDGAAGNPVERSRVERLVAAAGDV